MPEVTVTIGGHEFTVACQSGEEHFLRSAASMLDGEASVLSAQIGQLPSQRMLLMSGLMLADKTAGMEEQLRVAEERVARLEADLRSARAATTAPAERIEVEVPVIPDIVTDSLAEIAARAETLAAKVSEKGTR